MADRYVDPAATGDDDGSSWANAWTDMQSAATAAAAGDTVYCRGTQTLTSTITVANAGSASTGYIRFVGCNASGSVDGTRFKLNGNSAAGDVFSLGTKDFIWLENLECYSGTANGIAMGGTGQNYLVFINCMCRNNGTNGIDFFANGRGWVIGCIAKSNTLRGFNVTSSYPPVLIGCHADSNSREGFYQSGLSGATAVGCLATNNGYDGFYAATNLVTLLNCVSDGNAYSGVGVGNCNIGVFGCRLTNNGTTGTRYGLTVNANYRGVYGWNFLKSNKDGATGGGNWDAIPFKDDSDTNETSGTEGYVDRASGDYNLDTDATLRSVAIEID